MPADPKVTKRKITDYKPDPMNANKGTERGQYMVDFSVAEVGAGRSIVASADDVIPIGNHALQAFADAGLQDVIEVETDGKTVVVVKRRDWATYDDPKARRAALLDNRASEVGLEWSADVIADMLQEDHTVFDGIFYDDELTALVNGALMDDALAAESAQAFDLDVPDMGEQPVARRTNEARFPLAIVLTKAQVKQWEAFKEHIEVKDDTGAFLRLLELAGDA